jgi:hypothetical protein
MNAKEYLKSIKTLGLSIVGAAPVLGISRRQAQRIAADACPVPDPIAKLLRLAIGHGITAENIPDA